MMRHDWDPWWTGLKAGSRVIDKEKCQPESGGQCVTPIPLTAAAPHPRRSVTSLCADLHVSFLINSSLLLKTV
jgi:hypothetical protein